MTTIEATVRAMTKTDRRDYLRARGWNQITSRGSGCWTRPSEPSHLYTLAAAIRTAVAEDQP